MAKNKKDVVDLELQKAVIELLETGSDEGCDGTVVVMVEEFRRVRDIIKDRTGEEHGDLDDDNVSNDSDTDEFDEEEESDDEEDFDSEDDDDFDVSDNDE